MNAYWNENAGRFVGRVLSEPVFSHENHGEDYFRVMLRIDRLSGAEDTLPLLVSRTQLEQSPVFAGERLAAEGEVRSFNNRSGVGSRLVLTVFVRALCAAEEDEPDCNRLMLQGTLCRVPVYRRTPLGREISDLTLAVNRRYGRADYLPCICWGAVARACAELNVGDALRLEGRFQSRGYLKKLGEQSISRVAYEVSAMSVERLEEPAFAGQTK